MLSAAKVLGNPGGRMKMCKVSEAEAALPSSTQGTHLLSFSRLSVAHLQNSVKFELEKEYVALRVRQVGFRGAFPARSCTSTSSALAPSLPGIL